MALLIFLQTVGVLVALGVHFVEDESVLYSGAVLSITGIAIASSAFRGNRPLGFFYGMAVPNLMATCTAMIAWLRWGPHEAQAPLAAILVPFALVHLWGCERAVRELRAAQSRPEPPLRMQFGLGSLLVLTMLAAVPFAAYRAYGQGGVALAGLLVWIACFLLVLHAFLLRRTERTRQNRLAPVESSP